MARSLMDSLALHFPLQVEEFFHLFAVIGEGPVFGVVVGIDDGEHYALHVAGIWSGEIGGIEEIKGDGFAVGRSAGSHAWLVTGAAVVGHQQTVRAVEVDHGNHVFVALADDFAHQGGASGGVAEGNLYGLALGVLPFPGAGEILELVKGFLGGGLRDGGAVMSNKSDRALRSDFMLEISF